MTSDNAPQPRSRDAPRRIAAERAKRLRAAESIVRRHAGLGLGSGLIPLPLVDQAALTLVLLSMLSRLSELYGVPFSRAVGRDIVVSFLGGALSPLSVPAATRCLKAFPGIGSIAGVLGATAVNGSVTFTLGQIMIQHFESGGQLAGFDAAAAQRVQKRPAEIPPRSAVESVVADDQLAVEATTVSPALPDTLPDATRPVKKKEIALPERRRDERFVLETPVVEPPAAEALVAETLVPEVRHSQPSAGNESTVTPQPRREKDEANATHNSAKTMHVRWRPWRRGSRHRTR